MCKTSAQITYHHNFLKRMRTSLDTPTENLYSPGDKFHECSPMANSPSESIY